MGPVRHQQLIRLLACLVALDLVIGVAAIFARDGLGSQSQAAGETVRSNGILAAGHFTDRRGSNGTSADRPGSGSVTSGNTAPAGAGTSSTVASTTPSTGVPTTPTTARPTTTSTAKTVTPTTRPATNPPATAGKGSGGGDATPGTTAPGAPEPDWVVVDDPVGDTVVDGTTRAKRNDRADIAQGRGTYLHNGVVFTLQIAQRGDPGQDPNWASDSTFVNWEVDTNGDGKADYEIQFFLLDGTPAAGATRAGDTETNLCDAEAGYMEESYVVGIDPACLGSPAELSYRATLYYDTNPTDENAAVIKDVTPNGGFSRPVKRAAG